MSGSTTGVDYEFSNGDVIQEFGYDDDVDFDIREEIENTTGEALEDEDYRGLADGVLAWWRADDGNTEDLTDYLVDCTSGLEDGRGVIWLLTPNHLSPENVSAIDINDAASVAGLSVTTSHGLESGWTAFRITSHGRR